jgi:coproporphyrinogen III oxidase-like Fe-S oxidoreductase
MTIINDDAAAREAAIHNNNPEAPRKSLGLYLHIPFCVRKCNYCDFLSFGGVPEEEQRAYFNALIREIKYNAGIYNNK